MEVTQRETVIWELSAWSNIMATTWQDSLITLWNVIFFMNEHDEYFHQIDHKCGDKINIIEWSAI